MIGRELYMSRIRPFIGNELIKVLTGIRRSGKSVMLDLIQRELVTSGVNEDQFIFENMSNAHLCFSEALHEEITRRVNGISGKAYLFLMRFRKSLDGKSASIPFGLNLIVISMSLVQTQSCFQESWPHTLPGDMWNL